MLTDDERKTLTEAAKLLALDGMLDAAAGRASCRRHRLPPRGAVMPPIPQNRDRDDMIRAVAKLLDCSYLDVVPTPAENDHLREIAVTAREAMDRLVADAARWCKVAPLIERLADDVRRRELIARAEFDRRVSDTVTAMLAATQEPTL